MVTKSSQDNCKQMLALCLREEVRKELLLLHNQGNSTQLPIQISRGLLLEFVHKLKLVRLN